MDKKKISLSYSAIKMFKACPKKYYWRYLKNVEPVEKSEALLLGTEVHNYLESFYRDEPYSSFSGNSLSDKSKAILEGIVDNYPYLYSEDFYKFEIVKVEQILAGPIVNQTSMRSSRTFDFAGRLDLLVRLKVGIDEIPVGALVVVETKTSAMVNQNFWDQLLVENQSVLYARYHEMETGEKVKGVLFNVIQKPTIRQKKSETEAEFTERVRLAMANNELYHRKVMTLNESRYTEALKDLWMSQKQIRNARKENSFTKNSGSCFNYFRKCDFYDLCTAKDPESVIKRSGLYKKRIRNQEHTIRVPERSEGKTSIREEFHNQINQGGF